MIAFAISGVAERDMRRRPLYPGQGTGAQALEQA